MKKWKNLKHINGITETQLQCKAKVVSAKYGGKTTTIGHLVKGEVIQFDYLYVPPGSIIAFSVKLGMYSNIKYAKTTSDLKIIINVELGRHFLVLKFDKSVFQKKTKLSSKLKSLAMLDDGDDDDDDDYDDINNNGKYTTGGSMKINALSDDDDDSDSS